MRADGGIRHLWTTAGGPSIEIEEIDYAEVLREKQGVAASAEQIIAAALAGRALDLDDSGMRLLLDIVQDPVRLQEMMAEIDRSTEQHGATAQAAAFMTLLKGLAEYLSKTEPQRLDAMFGHMGRAAGQLSAEAMLKLLDQRHRQEAMVGSINVPGAVMERMTDESVSHFVAASVIKERGATERLALAFQALVPDTDRQRQLLALAEQEVAASEGPPEGFAEMWQRVEGMLTSYSDEKYVSEQYARELSGARTRAVDVERASDDPPERIATWLATVGDAALRTLDHQLLLDLLNIEAEPARWRDIAETATAHAEDLVRVGYFDQAWQLADAVVQRGPAQSRPRGLRLGRSRALRPRQHDEARPVAPARLRRCVLRAVQGALPCHRAAGDSGARRAAVVRKGRARAPPAARHPRRLRRQGPRIGAAADERPELGGAPHRRLPAARVRRLRGAKELVPLLADTEPLVQREAVQALMLNGTDEASRILLQAITSASGRSRETLLTELTGTRDERAAPLFCYLVRHMDRRKEQQLYLSSVVALGTFGGPDAVEALKFALHQGDFWSPLARAGCDRPPLRPCAGSARRRPSTCCARPPRAVHAACRAAARTELSRST